MSTDFLFTGFLRTWILLQAKNCGQVHGLGIIEALGRLDHRVSPGTVYPLLERLEDLGYLRRVSMEREKRRVSFALTWTGEQELKRMMTIIDSYGPNQPGPAGSPPERSEIRKKASPVASTLVEEECRLPTPPPRKPAVAIRKLD